MGSGPVSPIVTHVAGAYIKYRQDIAEIDTTYPSSKFHGVDMSGFSRVVFDFIITQGAGSFRPQLHYWNPVYEKWVPLKESTLESSPTNARLITSSFYDMVAIKIIEFTSTSGVDPDTRLEIAITARGII